jgi:transposase
MFYVGIDWSDASHAVYITDDSGEQLARFTIDHSAEGLYSLLEEFHKHSLDPSEILCALETNRGTLVDFLLLHGYTVYGVNPKIAKRNRNRFRVSAANSDYFDAMVLAEILRTDRRHLRPLHPSSELTRELQLLTQHLADLIKSRSRLANKLRNCLKAYFNVANNLFKDIYSAICLDFLESYPTWEKAGQLSLEDLKEFLRKHRYSHPKRVSKIYELLHQNPIPVEPVVGKAYTRQALSFIKQLKLLNQEIGEYEQEIARLFKEHPDREIFSSLPGVGERLGPYLIAHYGDNRSRYDSAQAVQCDSGTAPATKGSGKRRQVFQRRACRKSFRHTMQMMSFASLTKSQWARNYYDSQRSRGKSHSQALRALANKWQKIIFALWQRRTVYDEAHHVRMQELHAPECVSVNAA